MDTPALDRTLALLALAAALIVTGLVVGILSTGISQEFFQTARPAEAAVARLVDHPINSFGLRFNLGLDNLFILVYGSFFVLLAVRFRTAMDSWVAAVALGALLLTVILDAVENHHIAMMLHSAEHGIPLSTGESQIQMIASGVKFHASYLGIFLFAFGYRQLGGLGGWIAWIVWLGYVPFGILASVVPTEVVRPLALVRTGFFITAFLLSAMLFYRRAQARR